MRYAGGLILLVYGLATGTAAVLLHESGWWGLAWVTAGSLALMWFVGPGWLTRLPFALGFTVPVVLGAVPRAEGDYLIGTTTRGYLLLGLTALLVIGAIVTLPRPRSPLWGRESS